MKYDYVIIGGGIIGLSTAWQLQQRCPDSQILLLEKEPQLAAHQSSHNSGVIHAGLYYTPNSLKAKFCREGALTIQQFCQQHQLPYSQTGKLLVATDKPELERMQSLHSRCLQNNVPVVRLSQAQLHQREPNITGVGAIFIANTGMVNFQSVSQQMATNFQSAGGQIQLNTEVVAIRENSTGVQIETTQGHINSKKLITCAGVMADRLVEMQGLERDFQILPFRGEYYRLPTSRNDLIQHQIYPIPNPDLPFLGIHLTRVIDGSITVGPNAVLGLHREGYGKLSINWRDTAEIIRFPGFWRLLSEHLKLGLAEIKNSLSKSAYLKLVQKYCPQLQLEDLQPHPAGIRAQAVLSDGTLVHDFLFKQTRHSLHVCNAPSPAATSSIPIGAYICNRLLKSY